MASESDCFSKATVSTRWWTPDGDQVGGHDGGRAPDRPGGVHPQDRLAHRAQGRGQVELGHHHALEHVGGLADHHRVDVGPSRGRRPPGRASAASRTRPAIETSSRLALRLVWPTPITAQPLGHQPASSTATRFCWRQRARGGVGHRPGRRAVEDPRGGLADADQPAGHERVGGQGPARRVDVDALVEAEGLAHDDLLVGEGGVQLGHVDRSRSHPGLLARPGGRGRTGEVAGPEGVGLDAVVDAGDPGRALGPFAAPGRRRPAPRPQPRR